MKWNMKRKSKKKTGEREKYTDKINFVLDTNLQHTKLGTKIKFSFHHQRLDMVDVDEYKSKNN